MSSEHSVSHTSYLRVRYADTDQMGIVYYGKYFEYFEVARTEMLRECGLPYSKIEEAGYALPVLSASAKYLKGAKYDDLLRIETSMPVRHSPRLEITYSVYNNGSGELLSTGETVLGFLQSGRPSRPPEFYTDAIQHYLNIRSSATDTK